MSFRTVELCLRLGWPPTGNLSWRHGNGRFYKSSAYVAFLTDVRIRVLQARAARGLSGPLAVTITLHPPDRLKRDLDNVTKTIQDALTKAGVWEDDSQVCELHVYRKEVVKGGEVYVSIEKK